MRQRRRHIKLRSFSATHFSTPLRGIKNKKITTKALNKFELCGYIHNGFKLRCDAWKNVGLRYRLTQPTNSSLFIIHHLFSLGRFKTHLGATIEIIHFNE